MEQFSPNHKQNESGREKTKGISQRHSDSLSTEITARKRVSVRDIIDAHYKRSR
ncbi:hypothetical protein EV198_1366 [Roseivirga ehrenbergii]|uniref:hypothetical protein n=1 Tax=Roseivirga ehrenbergii (strain DSM 102268 / JCM 13514 / KCTC 12282 / NCIMB 14502 / KMM 6017) TaxID=279360 RepID=UPI000ADB207E|nr:hypothetical protein [Roseivirga ehrenbergii]TCL10336.1 hypothetical protein EV198_1366 [Roseivirga ehrenbergii]